MDLDKTTDTGSLLGHRVSLVAEDAGLVDGREMFDFGAELPENDPRVIGHPIDHLLVRPSAHRFKNLRMVPVIQSDERLDTVRQELVDETLVIIEPPSIDHVGITVWQDSRPAEREPIKIHLESTHRVRHLYRLLYDYIRVIAEIRTPRSFNSCTSSLNFRKESQATSPFD